MLVSSLITLTIAIIALYLSLKVTDEIIQLTVALTALFCLVLSLLFVPWPVELLMMVALFTLNKRTDTLIQAYVRAREVREIVCPFPLAFAIANRCVMHPTVALERFGEREIRATCTRTCCNVLRSKR
ncbi:MAG: hypothetical protein Fur006_52970 [Coleofasciculaceae cyanobacterium]